MPKRALQACRCQVQRSQEQQSQLQPGRASHAMMMSLLPPPQAPAPRCLRSRQLQPPSEPLLLPPPPAPVGAAPPASCILRAGRETGRRCSGGLATPVPLAASAFPAEADAGLPAAACWACCVKPVALASASKERSCTSSAYSPPSPAWPIYRRRGARGHLKVRPGEGGDGWVKAHASMGRAVSQATCHCHGGQFS